MSHVLAELCAAHGIAPTYVGIDGVERAVPEETLARLAELFSLDETGAAAPPGIAEARAEASPLRCHVPEALEDARVWGLTCQLPSLVSERNLGIGDFADLAEFCRVAAAEGADFVGLNPLHALFWSDPERISPFSPSNRRFLNPVYLALDWIEGFEGLSREDAAEARHLRADPLLEPRRALLLKDRLLRRLFERSSERDGEAFRRFCREGGPVLEAHAVFEAISHRMVEEGHGAGWPGWPEALQDRESAEVAALADELADEVAYHLWLQWQTERQVERVQREAIDAGMRVGLYVDFAVGASPDGSATWIDPGLTVPGASIGAPPDYFNLGGQDWGLAPISPVVLAERECRPWAEIMAWVMRPAGAVRIDHAMSLGRLWLIPRGMRPTEGAYVHYPLPQMLARLAEASEAERAMVIGEDLGVVPKGFRPLMAERNIHAYKVFFFEREGDGFADPKGWPKNALACLATHDTPTFTGWWRGTDLTLRRTLGMLDEEGEVAERKTRAEERAAVSELAGGAEDEVEISARLHAHIAEGSCRLAALQIEDALGIEAQVNVPGTIDEHPNWRSRLPVAVDVMAEHSGFRAHVAAMRAVRPK